jgi:nucleoside-diphosphate-sugar epimerase
VTGASGFIGSHLVDRLLADGDEVIGFDARRGPSLDEASAHHGFTFVEGDVRDDGAVDRLLAAGIDVVYHLAAIVGVRNYIADPMSVLDVNVLGTRNVLTAAERHGSAVLLTSTSEVFGRNPKVPWDEDDDRVLGSTRVDRWSYSTSKAMCEHMAFAMHRHRGLPVTVVRYFNAYGPRQAPIYVVSQSVHRVLNGEPPLVYDDGRQTRCFTYVGDAIDGTVRAARHPEAVGEAFNIGSPIESTVREVIDAVLAEAGSDLEPRGLESTTHYGETYEDIPRRIPGVAKADRILGWRVTTDLPSGIRRTIDWARAHPAWLATPA